MIQLWSCVSYLRVDFGVPLHYLRQEYGEGIQWQSYVHLHRVTGPHALNQVPAGLFPTPKFVLKDPFLRKVAGATVDCA